MLDLMKPSTARPHTAAAQVPSRRSVRPGSFRGSLRIALVLMGLATASSHLQAQAHSATAERKVNLQVGGGFTIANPDYSPDHFKGFTGYADFDFTDHFGVEFDIHQINTPTNDKLSERTYEIGGRYIRHYSFVNPYLKGMVGRGVFNFLYDQANLAYNMYAVGGGIDFNVQKHINARIDYEYQRWPGFPPRGLQPNLVTVGGAYHF